jgi:hypothetical protein
VSFSNFFNPYDFAPPNVSNICARAPQQVSIGAPEVQTRVQELSKQVVQDLLADAKTMHIATAFVQQLLATREVRDSAAALTVWVLQVLTGRPVLRCAVNSKQATHLQNPLAKSFFFRTKNEDATFGSSTSSNSLCFSQAKLGKYFVSQPTTYLLFARPRL